MSFPAAPLTALLLLSLSALSACGEKEIFVHVGGLGPPQAFAIPDGSPRVTFLGGGITAGAGLEVGAAFPNLLQATLFEEELPFELINAGELGDTLAAGLRRLNVLLRQMPDLLIIELGRNDGLQAIPIEVVRQALDSILTKAVNKGVQVVLLGAHTPANVGSDYSAAFVALFEELAGLHGLPYLPTFMTSVVGDAALMESAQQQPSVAGQQRLAEHLLPKLRELLQPVPEEEPEEDPEVDPKEDPALKPDPAGNPAESQGEPQEEGAK